MRFPFPDALQRAAAIAIVGHARLAATPIDQLAVTIAFDVGRAILRAAMQAMGDDESRHAAL